MTSALLSKLSIAPMIDWTYTHFRVLMRLIAPQSLLYTEMQTTGAVHNNPKRALTFQNREHPIALQLGGSNAKALAECAQKAEQEGYDEINLNLGCPSDKVQAGRFGACLMNESQLVAECIHAMKQVVSIPVSAKTRIGIDEKDSFNFFSDFVHKVIDAGCDKLIVHARKAWLSGLNPKQNRTIPPVIYDYVYRIKEQMTHIPIVINGNINTVKQVQEHMELVDGVMLGRLACDNPYYLSQIHQALYPNEPIKTRHQILKEYVDYLLEEHLKGVPLSLLIKPLFNFSHGNPGAKVWKRKLMEIMQTGNLALFVELLEFGQITI